jgi:hypothetical protein
MIISQVLNNQQKKNSRRSLATVLRQFCFCLKCWSLLIQGNLSTSERLNVPNEQLHINSGICCFAAVTHIQQPVLQLVEKYTRGKIPIS